MMFCIISNNVFPPPLPPPSPPPLPAMKWEAPSAAMSNGSGSDVGGMVESSPRWWL